MAIATSKLFSISDWLPIRFRSIADNGEALRIRIFLILILLCIIPLLPLLLALSVTLIFGHAEYWQPAFIVAVIVSSQIACLLYFLKSGNIGLCSVIYSIIIFVLIGNAVLFTGGWHSPVCSFMLALPVIACLVLTRMAGIIFSLAVLLLYIIFYLLDQHGYNANQLIPTQFLRYATICMWFTALFFVVGCLLLFDLSTSDLSKIMQEEKKQWQKDLDYDDLTNTLNQKTFLERIKIARNNTTITNTEMALVYIHISNLKDINHDFGFEVGDYLLKTIATNIQKILPENAQLSRYAPDGFAILVTPLQDIGKFISHIFCLRQALQQEILFKNELSLIYRSGIGAVISSNEAILPAELVNAAKEQIATNSEQLYARK